MLLEALSEAGGAIDANGRYPINDAIRQRLRRILINGIEGDKNIFGEGASAAQSRALAREISSQEIEEGAAHSKRWL